MTDDTIPAFLRLTPEERRQSWIDNPPRPYPRFNEPRPEEDDATKQLRAVIEAADRDATYRRLRKAGFVKGEVC